MQEVLVQNSIQQTELLEQLVAAVKQQNDILSING